MKKRLLIVGAVILIITAIYAQSQDFFTVRIAHSLTLKPGSTIDINGTANISGTTNISGITTITGTTSMTGIDSLSVTGGITAGTGFWAGAPSQASNDMSAAFFYKEDFIGTPFVVTTNAWEGWKAAGDASYVVAAPTGTLGGIVSLTPATGSNNEVYFQLGELGTETFIEYTISSSKKSWVEFRFAIDDTSADTGFVAIGLAEEGSAAGNFLADAGNDIADKDFIGAIIFEDKTDTLKFIYQTSGSAFVTLDSTIIDSMGYHTFGINFDGDSTVAFYWDGSEVATVFTSATGFPDGEELSPIIAVKNGAQDKSLFLDWIKFISER